MLITISICIIVLVVTAYQKGVKDARKQPDIRVIHRVPERVEKIKVTHYDEYGIPLESFEYEKDNRWLSGYVRVITNM